jgi:hypothetical protein
MTKIVIIDHSKGTEITGEMQSAANDADWTVHISQDDVITVDPNPFNSAVMTPPEIKFFRAVHRDVISGEKSAAAREKQLEKLDEIKGEDPLKKAADVWKDSPNQDGPFPGNHGVAQIVEG